MGISTFVEAPFRTDITSLVKPGTNSLKIEVMNRWINRLSGVN